MKYHVVEEISASSLQERVQELINKGWEPLGGLSVATGGVGKWWFYQAMVLRG